MTHGPPPPQHSPGWVGKPFHHHHHQTPPPPPPPQRSHSYQFRPPHSYMPHPLRNSSGNYGNAGGGYYDHGNGPQSDSYHNWAPPPPLPPPGYHQSHKNQQSGTEPISLRQVLGEKLEQEIFPREGGGVNSVDFPSKDESSPSPSKRWSVSSFPPQVSSSLPPISNGMSSSGWNMGGGGGGGGPSARHSVTVSPFQDGGDNSVISDLTSSWPTGIWSSPVPTSRQPQSPFSPSASSLPPRTEDGWGVGGTGGGAQSDLVELMKSLDIAEHIPALKVGGAFYFGRTHSCCYSSCSHNIFKTNCALMVLLFFRIVSLVWSSCAL